jgi:hypothetical protein
MQIRFRLGRPRVEALQRYLDGEKAQPGDEELLDQIAEVVHKQLADHPYPEGSPNHVTD